MITIFKNFNEVIEHKTIPAILHEIEKEKELELEKKLTTKKLKFNGNLNQLVDIFYQTIS